LHNYLTIYEEMYLNLHKTYEKFRWEINLEI
jgi:hypothetical protein